MKAAFQYILFGATITSGVFGTSSVLAADIRPNVVILYFDDMGYSDLGYNDQSQTSLTPRLDQLAAEGMNFSQAYSTDAVCTPSRYSLLTGRYSWRTAIDTGVTNGYSTPIMDENRFTIAGMLQSQGYHTAMLGKWHLGMEFFNHQGQAVNLGGRRVLFNDPNNDLIDFSRPLGRTPTSHGFDYFFGTSASANMPPHAWIENETVLYKGGYVDNNGAVVFDQAQPATNSDFVYDVPYSVNFNGGDAGAGEWDQTFITTDYMQIQAERATQLIAEHAASNNPFFLYVPFPGPHWPWTVQNQFEGSSGYIYGDYLLQTDHYAGAILDALADPDGDPLTDDGIDENTIVIATSDNGPEIWSHEPGLAIGRDSNGPFRGVKRESWEGGVRVPFSVRWPDRIEAGSSSGQAISQVDILATLADVTGYRIGAGEAEDSESFLAVLEGFDMPSQRREGFITHSFRGQFALHDATGEWKYIDGTAGAGNRSLSYDADDQPITNVDGNLRGNPRQLFNLFEDPGERNNLLISGDADALTRGNDLHSLLNVIRGDTTFGSEGSSNVPGSDSDSDGILNFYEEAFSVLDPNDPADAALDSDGDGASNLEEFLARTDPGNSTGSLQCSTTSNLALDGSASQSSNWRGTRFPANNAIDGNLGNFTHTELNQSPASWQVTLDEDSIIEQIVLHNRDNCCGSRLRDITVTILNSSGGVSYQSALLNPENTLNSPAFITLNLPQPVMGSIIQVQRTPDPDFSGGAGGAAVITVLSLGEVQVNGCDLNGASEPQPTTNLALNQPAAQSSTDFNGAAERAVDGNTDGRYGIGSVTHTKVRSLNPWWRVDLGATYNVDQVNVFNRTNTCCNSRLTGATVYIGNVNSANPDDYTAVGTLNGSTSVQTLAGVNTAGRYVMVRIAGQATLSLAEVQVLGN